MIRLHRRHGGIAQLGEHLLCKQGVVGSSPTISTSSIFMVGADSPQSSASGGTFGLIAQLARAHD